MSDTQADEVTISSQQTVDAIADTEIAAPDNAGTAPLIEPTSPEQVEPQMTGDAVASQADTVIVTRDASETQSAVVDEVEPAENENTALISPAEPTSPAPVVSEPIVTELPAAAVQDGDVPNVKMRLHQAVDSGDILNVRKSLLMLSSDQVNIFEDQESALHRAILSNKRAIALELIRDPRIQTDVLDGKGWSPLHHACAKGFDDVVQLLLDTRLHPLPRLDLAVNNNPHLTALRLAQESHNRLIVMMLKKAGAKDGAEGCSCTLL
eukprot:TRINITY_DN11572_c0_g1_i1.p1 TRINITY_DN11572_c0_g1~~TRINITY_DN11572_c0_g1_i1.p1  ORF type:complete len:266 (-),score=56.76 TRINITY_DN11572_c0_g1_i1:101-898(-)